MSKSRNMEFLGPKAALRTFHGEALPAKFSAEIPGRGRLPRRRRSVCVYPHKAIKHAFVWVVWRPNPRDSIGSLAMRGGRVTKTTLTEVALFAVQDMMGVGRARR